MHVRNASATFSFLEASTGVALKLFTIASGNHQMLQMVIGNTTAISASVVWGRPFFAIADLNEATERSNQAFADITDQLPTRHS